MHFPSVQNFLTHPGGSATAEAPCITSSWAGVLFLFVRVTLHQIELELMCTIGLQLSIGEDKYIIALLDDARLVPLSYKPNVLFHVRSSHVNIYFRLIGQKICNFKFPFNRRLSDFSDFHGIKIWFNLQCSIETQDAKVKKHIFFRCEFFRSNLGPENLLDWPWNSFSG